MDAKQQLEQLIEKAEIAIKMRKEYQTKSAIIELEDMILEAKKALKEKNKRAFTRNREFLRVREDENILFATNRYTMAPTYLKDGMNYGKYGLEVALDWFYSRDMMVGGQAGVDEKVAYIIEKSQDAIEHWNIGTEIGCYNEAAKESLIRAIEYLKTKRYTNSKAKAVVKCFDAWNEFQNSRILRSDRYPNDSLFLTEDEVKDLKNKVEKDALFHQQYEQIKVLSQKYSLDYIKDCYEWNFKKDNYEELNKNYNLWSSTGKTVNFLTTKETKKIQLYFRLPSCENETDGLGHVWIDNVEIFAADGKSLPIKNAGFEEDLKTWKNKSTGNAKISIEDRIVYCGSENKSLFMQNLSNNEEAICEYGETLEVKSSGSYTIVFQAKVDGKFKKGLQAIIKFLDKDENDCGEFVYEFNKKSYMSGFDFPLTAQADAILYAFTEDIMYAHKVKYQILQVLNDFCQGAEYWLITNLRPDNSDAYGAVQGGRILCSLASAYSLIKKAHVFSKEEKERFYEYVEFMLRYMMDMRDRTELTKYQAQHNCGNWQTDMCAGTGMMMMVLDDFPNRKVWLNNANYILRAQLEMNVNPDGSWPESIRYHHAALERFAGYSRVISHNLGEDWLNETKLIDMFAYTFNMQTPAYEYFDYCIGTPPFGDHLLSGGTEFSIYSVYLNDIAKKNKALADSMYVTWMLANKPMKRFWTESILLDNLLGVSSQYKLEEDFEFNLKSTQDFKYSGNYIFRKNFGKKEQSYMAVMSSPKKIAHGHLDQGAFMIFKNSIPIVMDSGIEGYFDSSTNWHISSYSHACMQFATEKTNVVPQGNGMINLSAGTYSLERGWADVPESSKVLECNMGEDVEYISIEIKNPEGKGIHIRTITYHKQYDVYIIKDEVRDFKGEVLWNLPIASKETTILEKGKIYAQGYYDVDLEIQFLNHTNNLWVDKGRTTKFFETDEKVPMMDYVRATSNAEDGFLVILHPKTSKEENMETILKNNAIII